VRDEIIPANPALMVDKPAVPDSPSSTGSRSTSQSSWSGVATTGSGQSELATYTGLRSVRYADSIGLTFDLAGRQIVVRHNRVRR
jgi:hypothetical protein